MTKHRHAELIKAWADGAVIQYFRDSLTWEDVPGNAPVWDPTIEYRIKPQKRHPVLITRNLL